MPIDRYLWEATFSIGRIPKWQCPTCRAGLLELKESDLIFSETRLSREQRDPTDWEVVEYVYSAVFHCSNESCREIVSSSGRGDAFVDMVFDEDNTPGVEYRDVFTPEYFLPPLILFPVPHKTPRTAADEIRASFGLFFCDPSAAANHIRNCVEEILTDQGVRRFEVVTVKRSGTARNERRPIPLHRRILLFQSRNREIADRLMAVKYLGNAGSHPGALTKEDVLDAYDILESVLSDLYVDQKKTVARIVSKVNKRKGPIRR